MVAEIILLALLLPQCQRFVQQWIKQASAGVVAGYEACRKLIAQFHEFIDFGNEEMVSKNGQFFRGIKCTIPPGYAALGSGFRL